MRKIWNDLTVFSAVAVGVVLLIILLIRLTPKPPVAEMQHARESLSKAESNRAEKYSKKLFTEARIYYDSAMINWRRENKRFLYFRNYEKVKMFAELSAKKADNSSENSLSSSSSLIKTVLVKIDTLNNLIANINKLFSAYPLSAETRTRISKGKMMFEEAVIAYHNGQYLQANRKITDSEYLLTSSYENATTNLKNYFTSFPVWKNWVSATINDSRKNRDYSIIIDKFSRKCFVYLNGIKKYEFEAELGANWVGDKRVKGDKATPEGMYKIARKFEGGKTKYFKALLLDYPNAKDKENFKAEIARGSLPASAMIGGLIEIHGNGGKGIDWTEGCIALTDKEIELVYKSVRVGTPVTIVGSIIDLQNVMNR